MRLAKLNRTMSHRNAMFRNMVSSLIEHEQIKTTLPKAKAISRLAERVITWTKAGAENVFYQRKIESYLMNWTRVRTHLFQTLAKRYENRVGGYTRVHRLGHRADDHAPLAIIELVDNARDLKRDKVIRTASRELATLELSTQSRGAKVPNEIWRNVKLEDEASAKRVIEQVKKLLPKLTNQNLDKVLSEAYVNAYTHCQPISIPSKEEAQAEIEQIKERKRADFLARSTDPASSTPLSPDASSSSTTPTASSRLSSRSSSSKPQRSHSLLRSVGLPSPIGAYTDFLYSLRFHFHRNLATLDPSKLSVRSTARSGAMKKRFEKLATVDDIVSFEEADQGPQFRDDSLISRPVVSQAADKLSYWDSPSRLHAAAEVKERQGG